MRFSDFQYIIYNKVISKKPQICFPKYLNVQFVQKNLKQQKQADLDVLSVKLFLLLIIMARFSWDKRDFSADFIKTDNIRLFFVPKQSIKNQILFNKNIVNNLLITLLL